MHIKKDFGSVTFLVITFVVLMTFSVWYYLYQLPEQEYWVSNEVVSVATTTDVVVNDSDWKTYRNEKYGFEVSYPENFMCNYVLFNDYKVVECDPEYVEDQVEFNKIINKADNINIFSNEEVLGLRINMFEGVNSIDTSNLKKLNQDKLAVSQHVLNGKISKEEIIKINNQDVLSVVSSVAFDENHFTWIYFMRGDKERSYKVVSFTFQSSEPYITPEQKAKIESILSTFKFTGPTLETSDWKTYKNEKYGFEFSYPQDFINIDTYNKNDMSLPVFFVIKGSPDKRFSVDLSEWKYFKELEDIKAEFEAGGDIVESNVINGVNVLLVQPGPMSNPGSYAMVVKKANGVFVIFSGPEGEFTKEVFNTVKFTN